MDTGRIKVKNYGEMLAAVNDLELVEYDTDGSYQGHYKATLKDDSRLFYYFGNYGSCSGCDWLEDNQSWEDDTVAWTDAVNYCAGVKPTYIVPLSQPLKLTREEYEEFDQRGEWEQE